MDRLMQDGFATELFLTAESDSNQARGRCYSCGPALSRIFELFAQNCMQCSRGFRKLGAAEHQHHSRLISRICEEIAMELIAVASAASCMFHSSALFVSTRHAKRKLPGVARIFARNP